MLRRCENVIAGAASRQRCRCNMATWFFGLTVVILALIHPSRAIITNEEIVKMTDTQAVAGGTAHLMCDMEPPMPGDKVHLVIWYKEGNDTPIYSFDLRSQASMDQGNHWQDTSLTNRAFFLHSVTPAKLRLEGVRENDAGLYRCRVDFKQSPTRNSKVNLTIIIPPDQLIILDKDETSNIKNYILGPYPEGSSLNITCVASGGRPQPRVTWWQQNALLDDSYEVIGTKRVRNVLTIEKLERKHLKAQLTCQASNNNLVSPISSTVSLDMSLRPLWVRLQGNNRPFSAGKTYEITCEVVGARPEPKIVWTKGGIVLDSFKQRQRMSPDGNTTTSTLTFVPEVEDAGKFLSCKGSVPAIPDSEMEDDWKLEIHHAPETTLELGSNLNSSAIREGMDVYFECNIKSNPWVVKVSWKHNGVPLYSNTTAGTIVSNQSLVLQSVTRNRAGIYTCIGTNQEGEGESNQLKLDIKWDKLSRPPSPENCTILEESRTSVKVSCAESEYVDAKSATYVLQVFDAETRRLLASATSLTPSNLEVTDLPSERSQAGLVLSLRVMTAHATSDATVLHSHQYAQEGKTLEHQRFPALSPVILSLSGPVLGAVVGAAAGLLLVIFVIVLAVRLRYRPRPQEDKDSHDDGGMATLTAPGDKSSSLPMSSDSIESFEKDPDIIPHGNDNSYGELCKGTSPRYVLQQPFTESTSLGHINSATKIPYSDLTLRGNRRIPPNCYQPVPVSSIQRTQLLPMSTLTRRQQTPDPAMYTQVASQSNKPIYIPPPRQYLNRPADESTAETPLIGCDNKITTITETTNLWNTEPTPSTITSTT